MCSMEERNLDNDFVILECIHEGTLCKNSDRAAYLEIKNWLSRNSGVSKEAKKKLKVHEVG